MLKNHLSIIEGYSNKMIKFFLSFLFILNLIFSTSLQDMYNNSESLNGYDRYIILNENEIYTGGIGVFEESAYIEGNGAIINLELGLGFWVYSDSLSNIRLDISRCTIINGSEYALSYSGYSQGNIINCNLINSGNGIKLFEFSNLIMKNCNLINNNNYGVGIYSTTPTLFITYSNAWENGNDYMENCPGWGTGNLYNNPNFIDIINNNFNYNEESICIDSGDPDIIDPDNTRSDIGSNYFIQSIMGDCNNGSTIDITDIVYIINYCIIYENSCTCGDMNEDLIVNVLDIVIIINQILFPE